jgi:hypothetical protein
LNKESYLKPLTLRPSESNGRSEVRLNKESYLKTVTLRPSECNGRIGRPCVNLSALSPSAAHVPHTYLVLRYECKYVATFCFPRTRTSCSVTSVVISTISVGNNTLHHNGCMKYKAIHAEATTTVNRNRKNRQVVSCNVGKRKSARG